VWLATNYPLQQIYGLTGRDRVGNLALCQVVAAGNSPIRTAQLGQLHFEPFWGAVMAVLSGFSPDRLLWLYPFMALVTAAGFAVSLYVCFQPWSGWERALVAGFATLLSSAPFEYTGIYRLPWTMTFLLKPNHSLGLVLFPVVIAMFVRARGFRGRLVAGLMLHLLAHAFVLHMVYVSAGLVLYAAAALITGHSERRRDVWDVVITIGINVLVVSPYLAMLLWSYPFTVPSPLMTIAETSPHLLEVSARAAPLFALGIWGGICAWRRQDRLGRVWATQLLAAYLIWIAYLGLSALQQARERDDLYYWVRFLTAASAAIGVWDLARRMFAGAGRRVSEAALACGIALAALPYSLPYWYDPPQMDSYFTGSLAPVEERLRVPTAFLRAHTERDAVVLSDGDFARYAAAFGARRVLLADNFHRPPDYRDRVALQDAVLTDSSGAVVDSLARYGARRGVSAWYAAVTPSWLSYLSSDQRDAGIRRPVPLTLAAIRGLPHLSQVFFWGDESGDFVAVFRIR
jgi:hypothetical protein